MMQIDKTMTNNHTVLSVLINEELNKFLNEINNEDIINPQKIDLYAEYNRLNNLLFNNQLPEVTMKWNNRRGSLGLVNFFYNKNLRESKINFLAISSFHATPYRVFNDVLAHEMIHIKTMVTKTFDLKDGHGRPFTNEANRINSMGLGFNITKTNDEELNVSDKVKENAKTLIAIIIRLDGKFYISVTTPSVFNAEYNYIVNIYQKLLNYGRYKTIDILAIQTKNPELLKYGIRRSYKNRIKYFDLPINFFNELSNDKAIFHKELVKGEPFFTYNLFGENELGNNKLNKDNDLDKTDDWQEMTIS